MPESIHKKLERVRKPHVHITYEVFKDGATEIRELPFVVGVLGDFSGNPSEPLEPLRDREFVEVNRDNFDEVMEEMRPELNFRVENTLKGDDSEMAVNLKFRSMKDFEPAAIVEQVDPLKELMEVREKLKTALARADRDPKLEDLLAEIINSEEARERLRNELGK